MHYIYRKSQSKLNKLNQHNNPPYLNHNRRSVDKIAAHLHSHLKSRRLSYRKILNATIFSNPRYLPIHDENRQPKRFLPTPLEFMKKIRRKYMPFTCDYNSYFSYHFLPRSCNKILLRNGTVLMRYPKSNNSLEDGDDCTMKDNHSPSVFPLTVCNECYDFRLDQSHCHILCNTQTHNCCKNNTHDCVDKDKVKILLRKPNPGTYFSQDYKTRDTLIDHECYKNRKSSSPVGSMMSNNNTDTPKPKHKKRKSISFDLGDPGLSPQKNLLFESPDEVDTPKCIFEKCSIDARSPSNDASVASNEYGAHPGYRSMPRNSRDRDPDIREPIEPLDPHRSYVPHPNNHYQRQHHHHHQHNQRESSIKRGQFTRSLSNTEPPPDEKTGEC